MKKIVYMFGLLTMIVALPLLTGHAQEGTINDQRVKMIYWDRYDWNVFYTGVTNKLSYQTYRPCVGVKDAGFECGAAATQSQYKEFGLSIQEGYQHIHLLTDSNWYQAYVINP